MKVNKDPPNCNNPVLILGGALLPKVHLPKHQETSMEDIDFEARFIADEFFGSYMDDQLP